MDDLVRMISALPFSPPDQLEEVFNLLNKKASEVVNEKLREFSLSLVEYAENQWRNGIFSKQDCAFSNGSSNCLPERMHSHIGCIGLTFLHCAFSNVSSSRLHKKRHSHIGCICSTFRHCEFSNVSSKHLHKKMQSHIGCICSTFPHCGFSNVSSKH